MGVEQVFAASGDFSRWYEALHPRLFASLLVLTGDRDLASDATDEALSRALQHWGRVANMVSPEGWTYRVAVNVARRTNRRRTLERRLLRRIASQQIVPAPSGDVWDLVRSLTDRQRTMVVLRYVADLAEADIAAMTGVTRGTVASTLADARRLLGEVVARNETDEEEHL